MKVKLKAATEHQMRQAWHDAFSNESSPYDMDTPTLRRMLRQQGITALRVNGSKVTPIYDNRP